MLQRSAHWRFFLAKSLRSDAARTLIRSLSGWTARKCEPLYTNSTDCVALWTLPTRSPLRFAAAYGYIDWPGNCILANSNGYKGALARLATKLYPTTKLETAKI